MKRYLMFMAAVFFISFSVFGQEMNNDTTGSDKDNFVIEAASGADWKNINRIWGNFPDLYYNT